MPRTRTTSSAWRRNGSSLRMLSGMPPISTKLLSRLFVESVSANGSEQGQRVAHLLKRVAPPKLRRCSA